MKLSSLALVAWMLMGQFTFAEELGSAAALPPGSHISPAAQNAAEAPHWNQSQQAATATPATTAPANAAPTASPVAPNPAAGSSTSAPIQATAPPPGATVGLPNRAPTPSPTPVAAGQPVAAQPTTAQPTVAQPTAAQPPQQLPPSDDAKPLTSATVENSNSQPENTDAAADQPRPLYSVMVRHDPKTTTPTPVAPTSEVAPARYEEPLPSPPARSPATAPSSSTGGRPANTTVIETPVDPEKVAAARASADLLATSFDTAPMASRRSRC